LLVCKIQEFHLRFFKSTRMLTVYFLFVVENWVSNRVGFRGRAGRVTGASREEGVIQS
jgi:hypothetical protein